MDLSKLTVGDLRALHDQVAKQLKVAAEKDVSKAREEIHAIAQRAGISLQELLSGSLGKKSGKGKPAKAAGKVPVQYRNPANAEQQWTGRGRQPKWVKEWLEAGNTIGALRL
jgi:DNA-binding protein H-NS